MEERPYKTRTFWCGKHGKIEVREYVDRPTEVDPAVYPDCACWRWFHMFRPRKAKRTGES